MTNDDMRSRVHRARTILLDAFDLDMSDRALSAKLVECADELRAAQHLDIGEGRPR